MKRPASTARQVRPVAFPIGLASAGVAFAALCLGGVGSVSVPVGGAGAAVPGAPYTDPRAAGNIGLCNAQGQQVTSGSIKANPFITRAVSTTPALSSVSGTGRTATLYAFQPVKGEDPAYWSGEAVTGASLYSNTSAPTAVTTDRDLPLSNFLSVFPPAWNGFIQLRIYLGAPDQSPYVASYPSLNLYVSGDTWEAVGGGEVDCDSGQAVSRETLLGVASAATTTTTTSGPAVANTPQPQSGTSSDSGSAHATQATHGANGEADAAADLPSGSSSSTGLVGGIALAVVVIGVGAVLVIRSRRKAIK
jgi:hypothetical protein